jgi:8-oxo-dGTP diphosphatase
MENKLSKPNRVSQKALHFAVLAADTVLMTIVDNELCVRLIPVHLPPYFNHLAGLPGGLLSPKETAEEAAARLIENKAKVSPRYVHLEQLYTFSDVDRDPRGRVVAVAYLGLVAWEELSHSEREKREEAWWSPVGNLPNLAYDHKQIINSALERLRSRITYTTLIAKILPREFTLTELEQACESILGRDIDKRNFRKKILKLKLVQKLNKERRGQKWRPAKLYSFVSEKVLPIEIL